MTTHHTNSLPGGYGEPVRAVIAPAACGGFVLLAEFTRAGRRLLPAELGIRWDEYESPNPAEIAAADTALTRLGIVRTTPWRSGVVAGSLTATLTRNPSSAPPHTRARAHARVRTALVRLFTGKEATR